MQCWQPCNSHVYFKYLISSGYLCFAIQLVLLFNYKTYGLMPGGFAPLPPLGAAPPDPRNLCFWSFFLSLKLSKTCFPEVWNLFWEKIFFDPWTPTHAFFQKSCVSVRTDGRKIIFGYYLGNSKNKIKIKQP